MKKKIIRLLGIVVFALTAVSAQSMRIKNELSNDILQYHITINGNIQARPVIIPAGSSANVDTTILRTGGGTVYLFRGVIDPLHSDRSLVARFSYSIDRSAVIMRSSCWAVQANNQDVTIDDTEFLSRNRERFSLPWHVSWYQGKIWYVIYFAGACFPGVVDVKTG